MKIQNRKVLNSSMCLPYTFTYPQLTEQEEQELIADLFEQLLLFDEIIITTNRVNFALVLLIKELGINLVEELIEKRYIKFMIWSPVIVSGSGRHLEDGSFDESVIYEQPPIVAGTLGDSDLDPRVNINQALNRFRIHRDRKRSFTRKMEKNYIIPNGMEFSTNATELVIEAYENNVLENLKLPYTKEPKLLNIEERGLLLKLGHSVLETTILSEYNLKSYKNFEHFEISKQNIENIGKAYNISNNSTELFKIYNLPNLRELFLTKKLSFDQVLKIRHLSNAKYYRKWINEIGEEADAYEISKEYINQIQGNSNFWNSNKGKLLKTLCSFGVGAAVSAAITTPVGIVAGLSLNMLETFWIDNILKGKNPSMFIEDIKKEIN